MPDWVQRLLEVVKPTIPKDFVGKIEINVYKGGISNINVLQSYKKDGDGPRERESHHRGS